MKYATNCTFPLLAAISLACLCACGANPGAKAPELPAVLPATEKTKDPAPSPPLFSGPPTVWSHLAVAPAWNAALLGVVRANLAHFEKARDREVFCPGYHSATDAQRLTCWVRLISVMVQYESNFNQNAYFSEPSGGKASVGLLMLSTGECANAPSLEKLKNGVENLKCGAVKMATLIAKHGYITSPDNRHGAAAYWSVLRAPYMAYGLKLGKKDEILSLSTKYKTVYPIVTED